MGQLAAGGSFLGNLMLGIYKGQEAQQHRADLLEAQRMKSELIKYQVEHHKTTAALEQKKLDREIAKEQAELAKQNDPINLAIKQKIAKAMGIQEVPPGPQEFENQSAAPETTPRFVNFPENKTAGAGGLSEIMAMLQANPEFAPMMKDYTGHDFTPVLQATTAMNRLKQQEDEFKKRQEEERYFKSQETHAPTMGVDPVTFAQVQLPGMPKYPALASEYYGKGLGSKPPNMPGAARPSLQPGSSSGGRVTAPGPANQPIKDSELSNWVQIDPTTMGITRPKYGTTPKQAEESGFKFASKEQIDAVSNFAMVDSTLKQIEVLLTKVIPKDEDVLQAKFKGNKREFDAWMQSDPDAAMLKRLTLGTLAPIIRQMGEKGALANEDVARALNLMPKLTDRGQVAWGMLNMLKEIMSDSKKAKIGSLYKSESGKNLEKILFGE